MPENFTIVVSEKQRLILLEAFERLDEAIFSDPDEAALLHGMLRDMPKMGQTVFPWEKSEKIIHDFTS